MALRADALTLAYDSRVAVSDVDLEVLEGAVTAIVGANASGKSTLLRGLARLLRPRSGSVLLDGADIATLRTREVARRIGLLPQAPVVPDAITVEELVARGRYPHQRLLRPMSREDRDEVERALAATGVEDLRDRLLDELSGGQRQRAWIAMVLAQETPLLLLDEPTTYLDLAHQIEVLDLLEDLNRGEGRTVVMVLHDLNQACRYASHVVALLDGRVHAVGRPAEIVDEELIETVFGVHARVVPDPVRGTPMCVPLGRGDQAATALPRSSSHPR
ncbi:MAG: ABC transporter ATP-binding protein [Thermoleophilaceae bacterium]|nr:ABC transporter ATP-binding protein [Thermoleophilaceae bacterium]